MKFGRCPRAHDPRVPKLSALTRLSGPPILPPAVDYSATLPADLLMYHNDSLGDCTCAAVYHAIQCWTGNANPPMDSEPENNAILLYEQSCGYNPADPSTDQGGVEQNVLSYWLNTGTPVGPDGSDRQRLSAFVEIDQRTLANVKEAIYSGGLAYIGFLVPAFFDTGAPVWDVNPNADNTITDGHAVVLVGYNDATQRFKLISWGQTYEMTYAFFLQFTDECYLLINPDWIEKTGFTPAGQTLSDLEALMGQLKWSPGVHMNDRHRWHKKKRRRRLAGLAP